jgi:hypothetical protein
MTLAPRAARSTMRVLRTILPAALLFVPTATQTQQTPQPKGCPRFARVPGYGACTNISGRDCGFCTYRCNDDTVVRWNVCGS